MSNYKNNSPYTAAITGGGFLFEETNALLPLLQSPDRVALLKDEKVNNRLLKINAETSLHVPETALREVLPALDHLYIDIKDMDPGTYRLYTGADNRAVLRNLSLLVSQGLASRCTIRIPLIPEFNTKEATAESVRKVREMGFTDIDLFTYTKNGERKKNLPATPENTATDRPGK